MKTKMKIKNEFQNPNLIFENENQKRKSNLKRMIRRVFKMKNKILKAINYIMAFIFLFFACLLDSDTWIPYIVCCVCLAWFILFMFVNREYLRKHRMIY